ncbi:MAG: anti-sigma regulatory factor [Methylococcus sp.]
MIAPNEGEMPIGNENDIVMARKTVREVTSALGFGVTDVTRIVTAASELTRNIYLYAGSGVMRWRIINGAHPSPGVELIFEDHGPGIADIEQAMQPGYTSGKGLGMGLPGSKRLMDELDIHSAPGEGTTVKIRKWLR